MVDALLILPTALVGMKRILVYYNQEILDCLQLLSRLVLRNQQAVGWFDMANSEHWWTKSLLFFIECTPIVPVAGGLMIFVKVPKYTFLIILEKCLI